MELRIEIRDILSNNSRFYTSSSETIVFGRHPSSDMVIENKYISSKHASLFWKDDKLYVRDEKSSNGSEVYSRYKWSPLGRQMKEVQLPLQIKLAEAVVVTVQSNESQIVSLSGVENDSSIMVLDICGSTRQALYNEELAFHLKQRLTSISKPLLYKAPVTFYKNTGDGFLATFERSSQAINCAMAILKKIDKRNGNTKNAPLNVRIGLHRGRTYIIDPATEDLHGMDINLTFRIEGLKKTSLTGDRDKLEDKNRILASGALYEDYKKHSRRKKEIFDLCGKAKLKGIRDKVEIYRINWR